MQLSINLLGLALAAAGATAAPSDALDIRQQLPNYVLLHFFSGTDCRTLRVSEGFHDFPVGQCHKGSQDLSGYQSFRVRYNELLTPLKIYSGDDCNVGEVTTVLPGDFGCYNQRVASAQFDAA